MIWLHDSSHAAMFQTELFTHTALQMFKMQTSDKLLAVLAYFVLTVFLTDHQVRVYIQAQFIHSFCSEKVKERLRL